MLQPMEKDPAVLRLMLVRQSQHEMTRAAALLARWIWKTINVVAFNVVSCPIESMPAFAGLVVQSYKIHGSHF